MFYKVISVSDQKFFS